MQSVVAGLNFQSTYFREHLLMAAIRFRSICFSENLKLDAFSLNNRVIVFRNIFILRTTQKTCTFILTSMMRGNFVVAFHHASIITFYVVTLEKLSLVRKFKNFDFFKATHSSIQAIHFALTQAWPLKFMLVFVFCETLK